MIDIFIDESGNLGKRERFFVISVIRFKSDADYKKWKNLAKGVVKNASRLKEIKSSVMSYASKKRILQMIERKSIGFNVWLGIIDTNHKHYVKHFITGDHSKELAFNYTLKNLFERYLARKIQKKYLVVCADQRNTKTGSKYSLGEYLTVELIHNDSIQLQSVSVQYCDSKDDYGVQLADLVANIAYTKFEYNQSRHLFDTYVKPNVLGEFRYPEFDGEKSEKSP